MINYETILSSYDNKLTLMQWLNKVEDALKNASLSNVELSQVSEDKIILKFVFADGSFLASPELTLPRGLQGPQGPQGVQGEQGPQGVQGEQGPQGPKGDDGTSVRILASAAACTQLGDGYIDANGHLQVLTELSPRTFTDAGLIRGPQGEQGPQGVQGVQGEQGPQGLQGPQGEQGPAGANGTNGTNGTDGADGVSVTNVAVTQTNHLIVTLSSGSTIDAGEISVSGSGGTQLYKHIFEFIMADGTHKISGWLISTSNTQITNENTLSDVQRTLVSSQAMYSIYANDTIVAMWANSNIGFGGGIITGGAIISGSPVALVSYYSTGTSISTYADTVTAL